MKHGIVSLVGAGPGDPELITVKGLRRLQQADVVVYDRLAAPQLLEAAPERARRIDVGKSPGDHRWSQSRIETLLIAEARRGRRVVRLKGGDPFVFGRGGEECHALGQAGIPYEVVPGVTSAVAAPAHAGIPLTHRSYTSAFTVVTGHTCEETGDLDWDALSRIGTLVILMGLARLKQIVATLLAHGRPADTPVAVISRASRPDQKVVRGTLRDVAQKAAGLPAPATIVVGLVAEMAEPLAWFQAGHPKDTRKTAREDVVA